jgi:hypothetical protein
MQLKRTRYARIQRKYTIIDCMSGFCYSRVDLRGGSAMAAIEPVPNLAAAQDELLRLHARVAIGIIGGLCAVLLKIYAQDKVVIGGWLLRLWRSEISEQDMQSLIGYAVIAALVMFLGGLVGFFVEERNRLKMLALGMSAPAMLTTFTGGIGPTAIEPKDARPPIEAPVDGPAGFLFDGFGFISSAYAAERGATVHVAQLTEGINVFLGRGPSRAEAIAQETERYWVIVGSERDPTQANAVAEKINEQAPDLEAFVGERKPGNSYYPIIVGGEGGFLPLTDALELREQALGAGIAPPDSYLSAYPDRLPSPGK